jgi:preprotein translocase subunit Sec63
LFEQLAKENWQKYGNPDGKQALEVSIGLPTFLLNKDNHTTILVVYLVLMVVLVPLGASLGRADPMGAMPAHTPVLPRCV